MSIHLCIAMTALMYCFSFNGVKSAPDKYHSELSARLGTVVLERDHYSVHFRMYSLPFIKASATYCREGTDGIWKWTVMVVILGLQKVFLRFTNISGIWCLLILPFIPPLYQIRVK